MLCRDSHEHRLQRALIIFRHYLPREVFDNMDRRRFLIGGAAGISLLAGCTRAEIERARQAVEDDRQSASTDGSGGGIDYTVEVGPGGSLQFEPDELRIEEGATVEFVWKSGGHNLVVENQPEGENWQGVSPLKNAGFTHEHTFEVPGTYEFVCEPHESAGATGTIEVGSGDDTTDGSLESAVEQQTVEVGPGGRLVFSPEEAPIVAGGTVTFVWKSGGHNIAVESQPDNANWRGVERLQLAGFEHEHTFDVPGIYEYHCEPHETVGMAGEVVVVEANRDG